MYKLLTKIIVFAPEKDVKTLIDAMAQAGAGIIGNYSHCAFVTEGTGYWKPLPGAHPTTGTVGALSQEPQFRIEMICPHEKVPDVIAAINKHHSYESPEINVLTLQH